MTTHQGRMETGRCDLCHRIDRDVVYTVDDAMPPYSFGLYWACVDETQCADAIVESGLL